MSRKQRPFDLIGDSPAFIGALARQPVVIGFDRGAPGGDATALVVVKDGRVTHVDFETYSHRPLK